MVLDPRLVLVLFIGTCILAINGDTDPNDVASLKVLFQSMNSPSQLNWNGDDPCGQSWQGITCSGNRVTEIKLPGRSLSGSLGYQLEPMSSVTNLDLSNNNLGGTIPYQLPPNLQYLNLANNNFNGAIPYSLSEKTSLVILNLGHNQLQQALNVDFQKLSSLSTL